MSERKEPKIERYPEPKTLYLRQKSNDGCIAVEKVFGETSRSWVAGYEWAPDKYQKHQYDVITEQEYAEVRWAREHQWRISDSLRYASIDPAILRQIAALIGYGEKAR